MNTPARPRVPLSLALAWHAGRLGLPIAFTDWPVGELEALERALKWARFHCYDLAGEVVVYSRRTAGAAFLAGGLFVDAGRFRKWSDGVAEVRRREALGG